MDAAAGAAGQGEDAGQGSDASATTDAGPQPDGGADAAPQLIEFSTCAASASAPASSSISFAAGTPVELGLGSNAYLQTLLVVDVNHDGAPDLVGSTLPGGSPPWTGAIHVALGNGDGTFGAPTTPWAGDRVGTLTAADVRGSGEQDLVVAEDDRYVSGQLWYALVLLNDGSGGFTTGTAYEEQTYLLSPLGTGDFNNDGLEDLLLVGDGIRVRLNSGGGFGNDLVAAAMIPSALAVGNFNGDSNLDIAYVDLGDPMVGTSGAIGVLYGQGDGTMRGGASGTLNKYGSYAMAVADFDGDGVDDIATVVGDASEIQRLEIFSFNRRCSGAQPPEIIQAVLGSVGFVQLVAGDIDGDGIIDVAVALEANVMIFRGRGDATFFAPVVFPIGASATIGGPQSLHLIDVNRDGRPDLVVDSMPNQSGYSDVITVLLNMSTP